MEDFVVKYRGKTYEFRLFDNGYLYFKDAMGVWPNANQINPIKNLTEAKSIALKMLISAGF